MESMLHRSRDGIVDPRQDMPRPGYRLNYVKHPLALRIELNQKSLLPLFDMQGSGAVHEAEPCRAVYYVDDSAEVDRPETRGVSLDCNQLIRDDSRRWICDSHPPQVELLPSPNGLTRSGEGMLSSANLAAGKIMRKTPRQVSDRAVRQCQQVGARHGSLAGCRQKLFSLLPTRSDQPEHEAQYLRLSRQLLNSRPAPIQSSSMPTTVRSFSKINLGLAIGPARPDGFHGLTTLYQTLAANDLVTVTLEPARATRITLTSDNPRVPATKNGPAERNTAFQAVRLALEAVGAVAEVSVHIEKRLPIQGGMGAGSANAAAALIALDRELKARGIRSLCAQEGLRIAAEIGSDVPLFLIGGAVLGLGRGEEVYPMPDLPPARCVIALPGIGVSTAWAFHEWETRRQKERIQSSDLLTGSDSSSTLNELSRSIASAFCEPHFSGVFALGEGLAENPEAPANSFAGLMNPLLALVRTGIENDFEKVVFPQNPLFGEIKRTLAASDTPELAAIYAGLSGSGSALFGLYATETAAITAEGRLANLGVRSMQTETLQRSEYWRRMLVE